MAQKTIGVRQKQKYDTSTNWTTNNPVLLAGEIGFESNTNRFKVGDGTTAWNSLGYASWDGIKEISTQYVRITDLTTGVYKLTYNGQKYIYYWGTNGTSTHAVTGGSGSIILIVNKYINTSSNYDFWHWFYINGANSYESIYFGFTDSSLGQCKSKSLVGIITTSEIKNNLTYSTSDTSYALSAYQGYVLDQNKQNKLPTTTTSGQVLKSTSTAGVVEWGAASGTSTDVQIDSTSITSGGVADIKTINSNYNASSNKLATQSDLPASITITTTSGSESVSDGTNTLSFGSNAFNSTTIPSKDSNLTNDRYVRYDTNTQGLTSTQKSNARTNIGAGTSNLSLSDLLTSVYPIGSIYLSIQDQSPASFLGGTWTKLTAGYALWTASSGAGNTINAGLPDISGTLGGIYTRNNESNYSGFKTYSGVFTKNTGTSNIGYFTSTTGGTSGASVVNFNASSSNSIYSSSVTTVQPPAYKVYAWRRTS